MERIDRLQEEVGRIARLLGDLAGQRGLPGTPADHGVRGEGQGDHAGQVRAPVLDYRVGPRSFEPQDRTADRLRAKGGRRMLRQRRMREQYFPADRFARSEEHTSELQSLMRSSYAGTRLQKQNKSTSN